MTTGTYISITTLNVSGLSAPNKIRDEKKFNSLIELKEQITKDIECLEL